MGPSVSWLLPGVVAAALLSAACQPAAPSPTAPPAKPAEKVAPAPKAETKPAASPAAKPAEKVAAKPAYDEQAVANFYRGQTIKFIVGFAPGGGFDTYTRAIARHFGRLVPGIPSVIVDNMPGGGSLIAANHVYSAAKPDGLTIGNWIGTMIVQQFVGGQGIEFDARKYKFLGAPTPDNAVCAVRKESGFRTMDDVLRSQQPLILGGTAPGSTTDDHPKVFAAALGFPLKMVAGYSGTATIRQAADSGEVHGGCWSWESVKVTWKAGLESGDVSVLMQSGAEKLKDLPNVPHALDLAKTEESKQLITTGVIIPGVIARPYSVHPDTPPDRLQALRQAFKAVFQDREFLDEAQKANLDTAPIAGEEVERRVSELFLTNETLKAKLKSIIAS